MKWTVRIDQDVLLQAVAEDSGCGFCLSCGSEHYCVKPDAEEYKCKACGEHSVFGAEQVLLYGAFK